jgi:signal transduction histidine kinase
MRLILPRLYHVSYYYQLDRINAVVTCSGLVVVFLLPLILNLNWSSTSLLLSIGLLNSAAVIWSYWIHRFSSHYAKYVILQLINPMTSILALSMIGPRSVVFFFPVFAFHLISAMALFRLRHILIAIAVTSASVFYAFYDRNIFHLVEADKLWIGATIWLSFMVFGGYVYVSFWHVGRIFQHLERDQLQFIQDASHELRTPLTVIKGMVGLMKDRRIGNQPMQEFAAGPDGSEVDIVQHFESATKDLESITERLSTSAKQRFTQY